jgi:O6-methylguanine-DNA--protein-cysteine methyltransferase
VSLTPGQQRGAEEVRAMADEMARIGGSYRRGFFTITTSMLTSRHRDSIVAHELATICSITTARSRERSRSTGSASRSGGELDANAKAVEILIRVRGLPEEQALRIVCDHLLAFNRMVVERRTVIPWGHRAPCEEIADLLGRFPRQRAWSAGLACAPKQTERGQVGSSGGGTDGASRANSFPG